MGERILLVMRHGAAEQQAPSDFERHLTAEGRNEVGLVIEALKSRGTVPTQIYVSPLVRARETADLVAAALDTPSNVTVWDDIVPEGSCEHVASRLFGAGGTIMLVTHQPFASRFVEYMTAERVAMDTAAIACISSESAMSEAGTLEWLLDGR